ADVGPEIGQQFPLIGLAVRAGPVQFEPVNTDTDNAAGAGVQAKTLKNLRPVVIRFDVQQNLSRSCGNDFRVLADGLNINDEGGWLSHTPKHTYGVDRSGEACGFRRARFSRKK